MPLNSTTEFILCRIVIQQADDLLLCHSSFPGSCSVLANGTSLGAPDCKPHHNIYLKTVYTCIHKRHVHVLLSKFYLDFIQIFWQEDSLCLNYFQIISRFDPDFIKNLILGVVDKLRLQEEGGRWSKKSTFCKHLYHRRCKRRGVGGKKKTNLVNVVCERPLSKI